MSFKHKLTNTFQATRPRHLLGNDPRKLVSHYEVAQTKGLVCAAVAFFAACFVIALIII